MSQFLYFIPGAAAASAEQLAELGLGEVLSGGFSHGGIDSGPAGAGVVIASSAGPPTALRYRRETQRWIPIRPDGAEAAWWLGWETDAPPGPAELLRDEALAGVEVTLGDGRAWRIPRGRQVDLDDGLREVLPQRETLGDDGRPVVEVVEAYRGLWGAAEEIWNDCVRVQHEAAEGSDDYEPPDGYEPPEPMSGERAVEIVRLALATNYRLGRWEISALGLIATDVIGPVLRAIADLDGFEEMVAAETAKKAPEAGPDGPAADC